MKKVLLTGALDVLHIGHIRMLRFAKELAGKDGIVFVAIDTDQKIKKEKGGNRPHNKLTDRMEVLSSIEYVDNVVSFDSKEELEEICRIFQPDIRVIGSDWKDKEIVGSQYCKEIIFFDRIEGYSTTKTLQHLL